MEAVADTQATESIPKSPSEQALLSNMAGLRAQLARVAGSSELAADLLHDAVVTTLQKLNAGEISDPAHLDGYVYRVALNHLCNYRRKYRLRPITPGAGDASSPETETGGPTENVEADQWAKLARSLLQEISSVRDRALLVRFYLQEESKEDLCQEYGLTEPHFNRVVHRARERFRKLLQRRGLSKADFLAIVAALTLLCASMSSHGTFSA